MQYNAPTCSEEYNPMAIKSPGKLSDPLERKARRELKYEWTALYGNKVELKQYDEKRGLVHNFRHIDQKKVQEFVLKSKTGMRFTISVNLLTGLFYINEKPVKEILIENTRIPLGLSFFGKRIESPWGRKAKLIYVRHVRRDFNMGFGTTSVAMTYELGYEAEVNGEHEKHTIVIDERGHFGIPMTLEQEGFKAL